MSTTVIGITLFLLAVLMILAMACAFVIVCLEFLDNFPRKSTNEAVDFLAVFIEIIHNATPDQANQFIAGLDGQDLKIAEKFLAQNSRFCSKIKRTGGTND